MKYFDYACLRAVWEDRVNPKRRSPDSVQSKRKWRVNVGWMEGPIVIVANTKSEARAILKNQLKNKKIPSHTYLMEIV